MQGMPLEAAGLPVLGGAKNAGIKALRKIQERGRPTRKMGL